MMSVDERATARDDLFFSTRQLEVATRAFFEARVKDEQFSTRFEQWFGVKLSRKALTLVRNTTTVDDDHHPGAADRDRGHISQFT